MAREELRPEVDRLLLLDPARPPQLEAGRREWRLRLAPADPAQEQDDQCEQGEGEQQVGKHGMTSGVGYRLSA
jgi:hypothetical protein